MAGGERGHLVEEEQGGPAPGRHGIAPHALPLQHATDPQLRLPARPAQLAALTMQAASIAHQGAAGGIGDDLPSRIDPVLQGHTNRSPLSAPATSSRPSQSARRRSSVRRASATSPFFTPGSAHAAGTRSTPDWRSALRSTRATNLSPSRNGST